MFKTILTIYFLLIINFSMGSNLPAGLALFPADSTVADSLEDDEENIVIYELDFGSNRAFKGSKSGSSIANLTPNFSFYHKNGFSIYVDGIYTLGPNKHWDQFDAALGYNVKLSPVYTLYLSYTHSFFNENTEQVNSALTENPSVSLRAKFCPFTTRLTYDYYFGSETDYYLTLDFYRYFYFEDIFTKGNDDIAIKPKLSIVGGTVNYLVIYERKINPKKPPVDPTVATRFKVVNFNLSLNFPYTYKKLSIEPVFNLSVPVNQPKGQRTGAFLIFSLYTYLTF